MIDVVYHRNYYRVTVKGHAGYGEQGEDLICAGASVLLHTMAAAVTNLAADKKVHHPTIRTQKGEGEVSCIPCNRYRAPVRLMFDTVCGGFELMAQNYPEHIHYEIHG